MFFAPVISNDKCALTKAVEELFEYIQQGEKHNQSDDRTTAVTKKSAVFPTHILYLGHRRCTRVSRLSKINVWETLQLFEIGVVRSMTHLVTNLNMSYFFKSA